ncbi:alpha-amylase family glycosyl hydrolase [Halanaerobacter jeridensis]|nr:alpha-amylase family glycosyl hydrolase [Halanaerobacter jeridensis]
MWKKKLKQRKRVREKYLLPKLYKLGYQIDQIKFDQKQLVTKGRRKIHITADVVVYIEGKAAIVIAVRSGAEELTDHIKVQTLSYARLLENPAPIIILTNGLEEEIYNIYQEQELTFIPKQEKLCRLIENKGQLSDDLRKEALDNVFTSISLWDVTKHKSAYYTKSMRPYESNSKGDAFNNSLFHNFNYKPNIVTANDSVSIRVSSYRNLVDKIYVYYTSDGSLPQGKKGQVETGDKIELSYKYTEAAPKESKMIDWWEGKIPAHSNGKRIRYIIEGYDSQGQQSYYAENGAEIGEAQRFSYLVQDFKAPDWAKNAIVYQIMIDRFCDGNPSNNYDLSYEATGYQGGDLQGIINKLNYIKSLGATVVWLSPVYEGEGYHGYHITNFLKVDPHFGDEEVLQTLIDEAHKLDLKVILDFVPNHTSHQHPFFLTAQGDDESPYYDWYNFFEWPNDYEKFCGVPQLPTLNTDNKEVRHSIIYEQALHWLCDYGADGLRLDYAYGLSHDFWTEFRKVIKSNKEDAYIFGEVWESPGKIKKFEGELDGCLDFSLVWSFRELFIYGSKQVSEFISDLNYLNNYYDSEFIINRFLDNHDMDRFLWEANGDKEKLKLAATCQFTLAGAQYIYYGTEVGLSQQEPCSDDNTGRIVFDNSRDFMLWGDEQDKELYDFYQRLCTIRNENDVLAIGQRKDLVIDDEAQVWVYIKYNEQSEILVFLNLSAKKRKINVDLSGFDKANKKQVIDLLTATEYQIVNGRLQFQLKPHQKLILA